MIAAGDFECPPKAEQPRFRYVRCLRGRAVSDRLRDLAFKRQWEGGLSIFGDPQTGIVQTVQRVSANEQEIIYAATRADPPWALVMRHDIQADA